MMAPSLPASHPALSRPVPVDTVPESGLRVNVEATPAEREALAADDGLVAVESLRASLLLRREGRDGFVVTGEVTGTIVQTCVVTLDPFPATVREAVEVHFLLPEALARWQSEHAADPADPDEQGPDEPDPVVAGSIDLGALVAEHLTLGLDPYPRKPNIRFEDVAPPAPEPEASPFAVLKSWRADDA